MRELEFTFFFMALASKTSPGDAASGCSDSAFAASFISEKYGDERNRDAPDDTKDENDCLHTPVRRRCFRPSFDIDVASKTEMSPPESYVDLQRKNDHLLSTLQQKNEEIRKLKAALRILTAPSSGHLCPFAAASNGASFDTRVMSK